MKVQVFDDIIKFYKINYKSIQAQEIYKWEAGKCFQDNWEIDSDDFYNMLKLSLSKTQNLMSSGMYFPRRMILRIAAKEPETARQMFRELFDIDSDIVTRIESFQSKANGVLKKYFEGQPINSYQDHRAIMVYLSLRYPEKYFLYKFSMFKNFTDLIDYSYRPKAGDIQNVFLFESLCQFIISKIEDDNELKELYLERQSKYNDPEFHLFAQDIIYSGQYYNKTSILEGDTYERVEPVIVNTLLSIKKFENQAIKKNIAFKASKIDYVEMQKKNMKIGEMGENFVYQYEREKVKLIKPPLKKEVVWVSKVHGDGLGYDILSYDKFGNEMYIEVKTTVGDEKNSFYITNVELEKSEIDHKRYYLYRVYDFDKVNFTARISVKKGSLIDLCISPQTYKVDF